MIEIETLVEPTKHSWVQTFLTIIRQKEPLKVPHVWHTIVKHDQSAVSLPKAIANEISLKHLTQLPETGELPELSGLELNGKIYLWTTNNPIFPSHNEVNRALVGELSTDRIKFSVQYQIENNILVQDVFVFYPPGMNKRQLADWYSTFFNPLLFETNKVVANYRTQLNFKVLETIDAQK